MRSARASALNAGQIYIAKPVIRSRIRFWTSFALYAVNLDGDGENENGVQELVPSFTLTAALAKELLLLLGGLDSRVKGHGSEQEGIKIVERAAALEGAADVASNPLVRVACQC